MRRRQDQWSHDAAQERLNNGDRVRIVTSRGPDPVADLGAFRGDRQGKSPHPSLHTAA